MKGINKKQSWKEATAWSLLGFAFVVAVAALIVAVLAVSTALFTAWSHLAITGLFLGISFSSFGMMIGALALNPNIKFTDPTPVKQLFSGGDSSFTNISAHFNKADPVLARTAVPSDKNTLVDMPEVQVKKGKETTNSALSAQLQTNLSSSHIEVVEPPKPK